MSKSTEYRVKKRGWCDEVRSGCDVVLCRCEVLRQDGGQGQRQHLSCLNLKIRGGVFVC